MTLRLVHPLSFLLRLLPLVLLISTMSSSTLAFRPVWNPKTLSHSIRRTTATVIDFRQPFITFSAQKHLHTTASDDTSSSSSPSASSSTQEEVPIHLAEGLFCAYKPLEWTSQDVVSKIRAMLEHDARSRGATLAKRRTRKSKKKVKVGHGGTLDPLAEGVLVIGIGEGTKLLEGYLKGSKGYSAGVELGYETNTLDREGNVTSRADFEHVTEERIRNVLPNFTGDILQVPPIFSALKRNGKKLYQEARSGKTEADIPIDPRPVTIHKLEYVPPQDASQVNVPSSFGLEVECGGGTYIRSLVRDLGRELGTCATMTSLVRTKQGPFGLEQAIKKDDWTVESIYQAVKENNEWLESISSASCNKK